MKMTSTTATAAKAKAKATTQRSNIMFFFAVLAMAAPSVEATRLAFHFDGLKHASCSSGTFKMDLNELKFKCNGEWDLCRPGDEVVVQGWFESHTAMPIDTKLRTKACKMNRMFCSNTLEYSENSLADEWHIYSMYGNQTYPDPGFYGFEKTFTMPSNKLTDFPWAGFQFTLVSDMEALESYSNSNFVPHLRCNAQFTTVNYDSFREDGSTGSGFSTKFGYSFVGFAGLLGAYTGLRERKRRFREAGRPALDLNDVGILGESTSTNFEMMGCAGSHYDEGVNSVRV